MRTFTIGLLALGLFLAGCSSPEGSADPGRGATTDAPTVSPPVGFPADPTPAGAAPSAPPPAPAPPPGAPASPPPAPAPPAPSAPSGPPYTGFWRHDHAGAPETLTINVAPGSGLTPFLLGFQPNFDAMHLRCAGPNATVSLTDPSGTTLMSVRAGDHPTEGGGCPTPVFLPDVAFTAGAWKISFTGDGDIIGYVAAGDRAGATNVSFDHSMPHDFQREENVTRFTVPAYANAVDITLRLEPRAAGAPCTADSIRVIVRDPSEVQLTRLDIPPQRLPNECEKTSILRDVILTPGTWSVQWGGSGAMVGSIRIEPARTA